MNHVKKTGAEASRSMFESPVAQFFLNGFGSFGVMAVVVPVVLGVLWSLQCAFPWSPDYGDLRAISTRIANSPQFECLLRRRNPTDLRLDLMIDGKPIDMRLQSPYAFCGESPSLYLADLKKGDAIIVWISGTQDDTVRPWRIWQIKRNDRVIVGFDDVRRSNDEANRIKMVALIGSFLLGSCYLWRSLKRIASEADGERPLSESKIWERF